MKRSFLLLPLVLAPAFAASALPPLTDAKLLSCEGLPCVDVLAGSAHLKLGVDTGNPNSFLNLKAAQALGLTLQPVNGRDGKPRPGVQTAIVPNVSIGPIKFDELKFLVFDLSDAIENGVFPRIDGTIAYGAFKDRILQLDYPAGILSVSQPLAAPVVCPASCGDISLIPFGRNGPPIVTSTGFTVNGKAIAVQIDTMFTGTLVVFPTAVERLGLSAESKSTKSHFFPFTDEGVDMFESQASQIGFGSKVLLAPSPLYFAGPKVHLPDGLFGGTVGAGLLSSHKSTLDFHDNKFWLD